MADLKPGVHRLRREENIAMDLKKKVMRIWIGTFWSRYGSMVGSCKHRNEPPIFTNGREFLE
jgi:hypothetical protein